MKPLSQLIPTGASPKKFSSAALLIMASMIEMMRNLLSATNLGTPSAVCTTHPSDLWINRAIWRSSIACQWSRS